MPRLCPRDPIGTMAVEVRDLAARLAQLDVATAMRRDGLEKTLYGVLLLADHASRLSRLAEQLGAGLSPGCSSVDP